MHAVHHLILFHIFPSRFGTYFLIGALCLFCLAAVIGIVVACTGKKSDKIQEDDTISK